MVVGTFESTFLPLKLFLYVCLRISLMRYSVITQKHTLSLALSMMLDTKEIITNIGPENLFYLKLLMES